MNTRTTTKFASIATAAIIALTGCSTTLEPVAESTPAGEMISLDNGWVKAAEDGMSAAFGELKNAGETDVTVVSVSSDASGELQLHETVPNDAGEMVMRERDGGFTIPAGGTLTLEPGGNHIMLMGLAHPINAGDEVSFTLTFSDDSTFEFTVPAKEFAGANENYVGGDEDMDHDMNMDSDTAMNSDRDHDMDGSK